MMMIIKIANVSKVSEKTKRYALGLMREIIKKNLFTSKDAIALTGTLVYMACKRYDERIVQYEIANASGVTIKSNKIYHTNLLILLYLSISSMLNLL